jgi:hypothetical protein
MNEKTPSFRDFHNSMRKVRRRGWKSAERNSGTPYVAENYGFPKGKKAIRAAKRERVKAMKATQSEKSCE